MIQKKKKIRLTIQFVLLILFFVMFFVIPSCENATFIRDTAMRESVNEKKYNVNTDIVLTIQNISISSYNLPDFLTFNYVNNSDKKTYIYSRYFEIEKKISGIWYTVPRDIVIVDDIGYRLKPLSTAEAKYYICSYHNHITPGSFRIVCKVLPFSSMYNSMEKLEYDIVLCEFIIE